MDASSPARRRRRLGRLALVFGIVGVAAAVGLMVINEVAPGMSGAARYTTAPAIDWFTIMLTLGGLLWGLAVIALPTALVLGLIVLVRWMFVD
ncbi:hypothetical protein ASL10_04540 [Frigoribacterium sp. Leaf8]|uniref:hypothetical protein n=1 Tax=Frigoribacterium sp. Leaf8 TaxID=1735673 RepID=UPI0006F3175C|nr:hypothetical protein [Frigoribacterium sp. Leaf8]KQM26850.1 hypothetical protein ASL10_04540 [Frigoribacterium sp. Leaf8]